MNATQEIDNIIIEWGDRLSHRDFIDGPTTRHIMVRFRSIVLSHFYVKDGVLMGYYQDSYNGPLSFRVFVLESPTATIIDDNEHNCKAVTQGDILDWRNMPPETHPKILTTLKAAIKEFCELLEAAKQNKLREERMKRQTIIKNWTETER